MCVAINEYRINESSEGTAGDTTGFTNTPLSISIRVSVNVLVLSLTNNGIIGDSVGPISNQAFKNDSFARFVFAHRASFRHVSFSITSNAAKTHPVEAGVMDALNISVRELCFR